MNILVVGANSLLGQNLVNDLSNEHQIYAVVRNKNRINFKKNNNIQILEVDLTNFNINSFPLNIDIIYYLAQSNMFREFPEGIEDMLDVNILSPVKLVNWAVKQNVRKFIFTSTGGIYTETDDIVKESSLININKMNNFYPSSKISAEVLLNSYKKLFETFVIARPFFMYGINQNRTMLIPRLIDNVLNGNNIILSNNEQGIKINPIYITDASSSFKNMIDLKGDYTFNIAGNEVVSLKEICEIISEITNVKPKFKYNEQFSNDLIANIDNQNTNLWNPKVSLKEGINKMVNSI